MMRMVLARLVNDDRNVDRLLVVTMVVACVAVTALAGYAKLFSGGAEAPAYGSVTDSPLTLRGTVVAEHAGVATTKLTFPLGIRDGGEPVNLTGPPDNVVFVSYKDDGQRVEELRWTCDQYGRGDGDSMLEAGEVFRMNVYAPTLQGGDSFVLEIRTPDGRKLVIERTLPDEMGPVTNLK